MAKRSAASSQKAKKAKHVSPLTSNETTKNEQQQQQQHRRGDKRNTGNTTTKKKNVMSETKLAEEAALTELLFGGVAAAAASGLESEGYNAGVMADAIDGSSHKANGNAAADDVWNGDLFAIDRSGVDDNDDEDEDESEVPEEEKGGENNNEEEEEEEEDYDDEDSEDDSMQGEEEGPGKASMKGAAWQDDEDDSSEDDNDDDDSEDENKEEDNENDDDDKDSSNSNSDDDDNDNESNNNNNSSNKSSSSSKLSTKKGISLVNGPNRLKKLRRYRDETNPLSFSEYELRLRERFVNTASVAARTDWADVGQVDNDNDDDDNDTRKDSHPKKKKRGYTSSTEDESSDEEAQDYDDAAATRILQSNASLFASSTSSSLLPLPPTLLNVVRQRDGNISDPNNSAVNVVQFHPGSSGEDENPLLMTAGMDKMMRFFRVDGEENHKIHGIHFPQLPITCASFLGDSGSVVLSGRRPFFYVYDAVSGNIEKIPNIMGRSERSLEKFTVSPDGRIIAFFGNDGYIILVDSKSRQWIGDLKMNGSVRAITFTPDSEYIMGSGSDGDVYRWHIKSRRCVERFHNEDGTITSSLAASSQFLAVGAESGVVNLYNDKLPMRNRGSSLATTERTPIKSIMNMQSSADFLKFNGDGQILAMSTRRETNGLKLLHVPTATVFSNWPTSKTPLKYVWSIDFSPGSKYFAIGNDHGKCLLYQLKHYWDE